RVLRGTWLAFLGVARAPSILRGLSSMSNLCREVQTRHHHLMKTEYLCILALKILDYSLPGRAHQDHRCVFLDWDHRYRLLRQSQRGEFCHQGLYCNHALV